MFTEPWFYIVMLGVAAILYSFLIPGRVNNNMKPNQNNEIEATLEQYMAEIENENQELIHLITQMKQEFTTKQLATQEQIVELRNRLVTVEQGVQSQEIKFRTFTSTQETTLMARMSEAAVAQPDLKQVVIEEEAPVLEEVLVEEEPIKKHEDSLHDRYPELFELYNQGKSIDMIAKAVGIQRGEVQLILQLANKEESS
ncbi:hypothetical protein J2Z32_000777 [Paenibacillus turicensis]|uniref:Uncharacterized protein n=1 Tax=Paenibacillus turicensis TaxID=160487 RepID=A0ABS4FNJ7_9BACL|nr:hypothetical protein [Paenibacillus turicensis]